MRRSIEPILRDLQSAGIAQPRIEAADWSGSSDWPSVMLWSPSGSGAGVQVSRLARTSEQVASVADQVRDFVIEELWSHASTNRPPCPRHPGTHPMKALAQDDVAAWVCPVDDTMMSIIGSL